MLSELKPCPFCGSEAIELHYKRTDTAQQVLAGSCGPTAEQSVVFNEYTVTCEQCGANIKDCGEERAIAAWNKRKD